MRSLDSETATELDEIILTDRLRLTTPYAVLAENVFDGSGATARTGGLNHIL